jgi:succinate dehydrogenase / fumarate reductase flavoprotein subunit
MQGLADGYFVVPLTIGDYFGSNKLEQATADNPAVRSTEDAVRARTERLLSINGSRTVTSIHRELGTHHVGVLRHGARRGGLNKALQLIPGAPRRVLARCTRARNRRGAQPVARACRPVADFSSWPN